MTPMLRLVPVLSLFASLLSGCASQYNEAPQDAAISTAADAPGFLIVGLVEENASSGLTHAALSLALALRSEDGTTATMNRYGCGSMQGVYGSKPCNLTKLDWQVLQVQPGLWRPAAAAEATKTILGSKLVRATLPLGPPIRVGSGEVVYIGDYILSADYDAPAVLVRRHGRDDAAAQRTLAAYSGLRHAQIVYRDSTAVAAAR